MGKKWSKKKMPTLVMSMIILSSLLGISYAQWTKSTIIETKIVSGTIEATGENESQYIMCAGVCCTNEDKHRHRQQSRVKLQLAQESIPIEIRSVKIKSFQYWAEIWEGEFVQVIKERTVEDKENKKDTETYSELEWQWNEKPTESVSRTLTEKVENIGCTYQKESNNFVIIGIGTGGQGDVAIKDAMDEVWSDHRPSNRPSCADIDVSQKGTLTVTITYTQFNTKYSGGWTKEIDVAIPVSWYRRESYERVDSDSYTKNSIYPNASKQGQSIKPGEEWRYD